MKVFRIFTLFWLEYSTKSTPFIINSVVTDLDAPRKTNYTTIFNSVQLNPFNPFMLKSEASPSEEQSPFYQRNKKVCTDFETWFLSNSGRVTGGYSAWALSFQGKIDNPVEMVLKVTKSTMSSSGNLLIDSKRNIFEQSKLDIKGLKLTNHDFEIEKSSWIDFVKSRTPLPGFKRYSINQSKVNPKSEQMLQFLDSLKYLLTMEQVGLIRYNHKKDIASIELTKILNKINLLDSLVQIGSK